MADEIDPVNKLVWVCRENIGRSQVAMSLWNVAHPNNVSISAGLIVDEPGGIVRDRPEAKHVLEIMQTDYGIDVSANPRTNVFSLGLRALEHAKLVVIMAEPSVIPDVFDTFPNVHRWEVEDMKDVRFDTTQRIIRSIKDGLPAIEKLLDH